MDLVADWISSKDLLKLHAISSTASCSLTIRFDEQILNSLDEQNSAVMSDIMFGSEGETVRSSPGAGLKKKRKKARKRWSFSHAMAGQDKCK